MMITQFSSLVPTFAVLFQIWELSCIVKAQTIPDNEPIEQREFKYLESMMQDLAKPFSSEAMLRSNGLISEQESVIVSLIQRASDYLKVFIEFESRRKSAVRAASHITQRQVIRHLESTKPTVSHYNIGSPEYIFAKTRSGSDIKDLNLRAAQIRARLNTISVRKDQIVSRSRDVLVGGTTLLFPGISLDLRVISSSTNISMGSGFLGDLVFQGDPFQGIGSPVFFTTPIFVHRLITRNVNHLDVDRDLIYRGASRVKIGGPLRIESLICGTISTKHLKDLNASDLVFFNQPRLDLSMPLSFDSMSIDESLDSPSIAGTNLRNLRNFALRYSDQSFEVPVTIPAVRVPTIVLNNTLNQMDFKLHVSRLVRVDSLIKIPRLVISSSSFSTRNLNVRNLNNQRFPDDFLLKYSAKPQVIPYPINFPRLKATKKVNFNGSINGLRYPDDFVTLDGTELIESDLRFVNRITFNKDVITTGRVGAYRVMDLVQWVHDFDPVTRKARDNPEGSIIVQGDLEISQYLNGVKINLRLFDDLVRLDEPNVISVTGTKNFVNPIHSASISVNTINNSSFTELASIRDTIKSSVRFVKPLVIKKLHVERFGGKSDILSRLKQRISLSHEGDINGNIFFEHLKVDNLAIDTLKGYRINDLSPSQLVTKTNHQYISGLKTFLSPVLFTLPIQAEKITIESLLNNRSLSGIIQRSLNPMRSQSLSFDSLVLRGGKINQLSPASQDWHVRGEPILQSLHRLLLKDGNQEISERKKFLSHVSFGSKISTRSSRGALHGIHKGSIFAHPKLILNQTVHLTGLAVSGNIRLNGRLNNIDLSVPLRDLQNSAKNQLYQLHLSQSFYQGLAASTINVKYLNGQPLNKYWSRSMRQSFLAPFQVKNLIVNDQIFLNGALDNLSDRIERIVSSIRDQQTKGNLKIHGNVVFRFPVAVKRNLNVVGTINNASPDKLTRDLMESPSETVGGIKTFNSVTFRGNLKVTRFNGFPSPLRDVLNNIVLVHPNRDLIIASPVEFTSPIVIKGNVSQNRVLTRFNSNLNGFNLRHLIENQQKRSLNPRVTYEFTDEVEIKSRYPVTIDGRVNTLDLKRDIVWSNNRFAPYQHVTGLKRFSKIHFVDNVNIRRTFNGIPWPTNLRNVVQPRNPESFSEIVQFNGKVIFFSNIIISRIAADPVSSFINIKGQDHLVLPSKWILSGPVLITNDLMVSGKIKNVSLDNLARFSLRKDVPQTVRAPLRFDHIVLKSTSPSNRFVRDLQNIRESYKDHLNQFVVKRIDLLDRQIKSSIGPKNRLSRYMESTPIEIKCFKVSQKFPGVIGETIDFHDSTSFGIGLVANDEVIFDHLVHKGNQFVLHRDDVSTPYKATHKLSLDSKTYLLLQASANSSNPTLLVDEKHKPIGQLTGRAYDELKVLNLNRKSKMVSALSSVRGVVETFTLRMVNEWPIISLISVLNVSPNARKITLFSMNINKNGNTNGNQIYLAVARSSDRECDSENSASLLYQLSGSDWQLIQQFNHFEASNVIHYKYNDQSYLAFSESKSKADRLSDKSIHIYQSFFNKWPDCRFNHFHSLDLEQTKDLHAFTVPSNPWSIQLLAALNSSTLTIWQQEGNAGFTSIWSQTLNQGQAFKFFISNQKLSLVVAQLSPRAGSFILEAIVE